MSSSARKDYIRERLFYKPEELYKGKEEEKILLNGVTALMTRLYFNGETLQREEMMTEAWSILSEVPGLPPNLRDLLLALLDGALLILGEIEATRDELIRHYENDYQYCDTREERDEVTTEIRNLRELTYTEVSSVLRYDPTHRATSIEAAYIREESGKRTRYRDPQALWRKLAKMLDVSIESVRSAVAHKSIGDGGRTVQEHFTTPPAKKGRAEQKKAVERTGVVAPIEAKESLTPLDTIYAQIPSEDQDYARELEPDSFVLNASGFSREQRRWIYAVILLSPEKNHRALRAALSELFGVQGSNKIPAVTAYLSGKLREQASGDRLDDIRGIEAYLAQKSAVLSSHNIVTAVEETKLETVAEPAPTTPSLEPEEAEVPAGRVEVEARNGGKTGDSFEYDNPIKRKWRGRWMEHVTAHTPVARRPEMKVLCLPGRECLEIPYYLAAGFRAPNIHGYESSKRVQQEFLRNAERFGIVAHCGDIAEVANSSTAFHVVNLDFTGPFSIPYLKVLQHTLLADASVVGINLLAKREDPHMQGMLHQVQARSELRKNDKGQRFRSVSDVSEFYTASSSQWQDAGPNLRESRNLGASTLMAENIGVARSEPWLFEKRMLSHPIFAGGGPELSNVTKTQMFHNLSALVFDTYQECLDRILEVYFGYYDTPGNKADEERFKEETCGTARGALSLFSHALLGVPLITDARQLRYISQAGSPYQTTLLKYERPSEYYEGSRSFVDFFYTFMESLMDEVKKNEAKDASLYFSLRKERPVAVADLRKIITNAQKTKDWGRLKLAQKTGSRPPRSIDFGKVLRRTDGFIGQLAEKALTQKAFKDDFEIPIEQLSA